MYGTCPRMVKLVPVQSLFHLSSITEDEVTATDQVCRNRLYEQNCSGWVPDWVFLNLKASKSERTPTVIVNQVPSNPVIETRDSKGRFSDRDCDVIDISSYIYKFQLGGEVKKTTIFRKYGRQIHADLVQSKGDVILAWDDSSLLKRDAIKMGTEYDRYFF